MVLTRTESTRYNTNNYLGEIINKFQGCNIKKHKDSWKKYLKKNTKQGFDFT